MTDNENLNTFYESVTQTRDVANYCGWTDFDAGGSAKYLDIWLCGRPDEMGDIVSIEDALLPTIPSDEGHGEFYVSPLPVEDISFNQLQRGDTDLTLVRYKGPWKPEFASDVQAALLGLAGIIPSRKSKSTAARN